MRLEENIKLTYHSFKKKEEINYNFRLPYVKCPSTHSI